MGGLESKRYLPHWALAGNRCIRLADGGEKSSSQGTVLRRIQKLHSSQEKGAAGWMREVSGGHRSGSDIMDT